MNLRFRSLGVLLSVLIAVFVAGCSSDGNDDAPTNTPAVDQSTVSSSIQNFELQSITVDVGTTVTWTNNDSAGHTVSHQVTNSSPPQTGAEFDSGSLSQGSRFSHTFDEAGRFQYYCEIHPDSMQAAVVVR
jgi:plastocyanin